MSDSGVRAALARRLSVDLAYTPSVFVTLAGLWLLVTPLVGEDVAYPWWNDVTTGLLITALGAARVVAPRGTAILSLATVLLGGWLIAAPFVLGFADKVTVAWNDIIIGVLVVFLAGVSAITAPPR